ncbi:MAG: DUF4338 domain-containing protein [Nitrococcus sp.]|nr:DUF4338 domain-containing protein [Nitrococcus sp.]
MACTCRTAWWSEWFTHTNWHRAGETQGRGKLDVQHRAALPKKSVWVYPLQRDFRRILCAQEISS